MSLQEQEHMWRLFGRYFWIGTYMAVSFTMPTLAGHWIDQRFHTAPWFFIWGGLVGLGAAALGVYRVIKTIRLDKL
jgi:hypothetical protein